MSERNLRLRCGLVVRSPEPPCPGVEARRIRKRGDTLGSVLRPTWATWHPKERRESNIFLLSWNSDTSPRPLQLRVVESGALPLKAKPLAADLAASPVQELLLRGLGCLGYSWTGNQTSPSCRGGCTDGQWSSSLCATCQPPGVNLLVAGEGRASEC